VLLHRRCRRCNRSQNALGYGIMMWPSRRRRQRQGMGHSIQRYGHERNPRLNRSVLSGHAGTIALLIAGVGQVLRSGNEARPPPAKAKSSLPIHRTRARVYRVFWGVAHVHTPASPSTRHVRHHSGVT
jgi:hypothetical protein